MTLECPAAAELRALLDDRLGSDEETVLLAHIDECANCQAALERLTAIEVPSAARLAGASPAVALPAPAAPPVRLGPFRLERELGRGGMGVVYLAYHTRLRRPAAVKLIRTGADATAEQVARFRNEAEALAALRHPNVIQVFESGEHEQSAWIALEYISGGTLRDRLGGRPLSPREAARLMAGVARGAASAHERGIIHRDLKPGNVLLADADSGDPSGGPVVKVTDFGLAKLRDSTERLTQTGTAIGTPHYMAPEQARGDSAGPAADVYAIGAMLYECLTGRPPFDAVDQLALLNQVIRQSPVPVRRLQPSVPRDLETVCLKCLEKEPSSRYASAAALADDLERFLAGRPTEARPVSWAGHLVRWCRRNPVPAMLAAGLVVAIVAGGVGVTWKWRAEAAERRRAEESADREAKAKQAAEEQVRRLTEAHLGLNRMVHETTYRLKTESADAALRALAAGMDRVAEEIDRADVADPRLRCVVRTTAGHAYRVLEQYRPAIRHTTAALTDAEAGYGPHHPLAVGALIELAALHDLVDEPAAAADFRRRGLDALDAMPMPEDDPDSHLQLSAYWREWAEEAELAVRLMERVVADGRRRYPPGDVKLLRLTHELAWAHLRAGHAAQALALERETALGHETLFAAGDPGLISLARDIETLMIQAGRTDPDLLAFVLKVFASDSPNPSLLAVHGSELLVERRWAEAEVVLRDCLRLREATSPDDWRTFNTRSMLGESLLEQGRSAEAERILLEGYQGMKARQGTIPSGGLRRLPEAAERLARLYAATDRPAEAAKWRLEVIPYEYGPVPRDVSRGR
jgi:hypothetical protein